MICDCELPAGREAIWYPELRKVSCLACSPAEEPAVDNPGASALREHERRRQRREQHAREKLGSFGGFLARVIDEPSSTRVWKQGGEGEARTAARLNKHLAGTGVRLLHDRRIPGHGKANLDHLAIGRGGVTVIDSKTHRGKVRVDRVGGLFAPRRTVLLINGRDRTTMIDGLEAQIGHVRSALSRLGYEGIEIRGALCFPDVAGLPLRQLVVRDVLIDGPKAIAKLAARPGSINPDAVDSLWRELGRALPPC